MSEKIRTIKHKDKRANIPTSELRGFVEHEEKRPKTMLYPRDPSLDPQLVWKGKDEQDRRELAVPVVPVYIQEKIHPQAIIEDIRNQAETGGPKQLDMFADFNGIRFEDLIEFYQHEQNWSNRMVLGDSLLVMTSLAEKEGLKGKVQMIYMDPPYGIKFGSNWQVSTRKNKVGDSINDVNREPEVVKAFRDTWKLGIHSYLSYLRDRLVVARELLTESGSIFVQIGDENLHLVRCLLDEVFGSENYCSIIAYTTTGGFETTTLSRAGDYILWYARDKDQIKFRPHYQQKPSPIGNPTSKYDQVELSNGQCRALSKEEKIGLSPIPKGAKIFRLDNIISQGASENTQQEYTLNGKKYHCGIGNHWKASVPDGMTNLAKVNRLMETSKGKLSYVRFFDDFPVQRITNLWTDIGGSVQSRSEPKVYVVQTGASLIQRCLLMTTDPGDLVLDPTCGSGTTAYVAEQRGRRWITIDTSRVALALARTRLMAARYPYYLLADSKEGVKKEAEITGRIPPDYKTENDIKKGFVYNRVPHITLKAIANNPEIDDIHARWEEQLEPVRAELDKTLKKSWQEWEIPREPEDDWPNKAKKLLNKWWDLRLKRQQEIDTSIARHADTELLYDQPYEDKKRIRVAGPFTVESLSPHRVLAADGRDEKSAEATGGDLINTLIDHLRKAGVQNTRKRERLKFDRLETYAGQYIQAEGEYTDNNGKIKRVGICFGPEHGTVGPDLIREAAKEAVQGIGFDVLLVCGFAFDPHCAEESIRYPKPTVLITRMNPDLAMGDDLLKKTGAGNLFMVFGEPDLEIRRDQGKMVVEIKGVDVYDPTTGQIRSSSTDDIACWFIDTNYNGESFFVRHAYFTGADKPYEKLKKALRAEIDPDAWAVIYSTVSRPFDPPQTGKIAVKVTNHYGDEVLKVYAINKI